MSSTSASTARAGAAPRLGTTRLAIVAALLAVYLIWGSTYLAISVALQGFPPFLLGALRFVLAGALLAAWPLLRGLVPTARELGAAAVLGLFLVVGGNGAVSWACPSGVAALVSSMTPCFIVLLDWSLQRRSRFHPATVLGLLSGIAATVVLAEPFADTGRYDRLALVVVLFGCFSWAVGSVFARRMPPPRSVRLGTGLQMVFGGLCLGVLSLLSGEGDRFDPAAVGGSTIGALLYLSLFGSVIGYGCYCWLLRVAPIGLVSTHSYVNPIVAVLLGWAFAGEVVGPRTLVAGALTLVAVVLISYTSSGSGFPGPGAAASAFSAEVLAEDPFAESPALADLLEPGEAGDAVEPSADALFDSLDGALGTPLR